MAILFFKTNHPDRLNLIIFVLDYLLKSLILAEYGNVGTEFDYITVEGFGWMNASYQYGLTILEDNLKQKLSDLVDPDDLF